MDVEDLDILGINVPCRVLQTVKKIGVISTQDTASSAVQGSRVNHVMRFVTI